MCCAKKVRRLWLLYTAGFLLFAAMTSCQQNRSVVADFNGMSDGRGKEGHLKACNFVSHNESGDSLRMDCFSRWSPWSECDPATCVQTRSKQCKRKFNCKGLVLKEERACSPERRRRLCRDRRHTSHKRHKRKPPPFHVVTDTTSQSIRKIGADLLGRSGEHEIALRGEHKKAYSRWSRWTTCTKSCTTQRYRWCKRPVVCGNDVIRETAFCYMEGTYCQVLVQKRKSQIGNEDSNALYSVNQVSNHPTNAGRLNSFVHTTSGSDVFSNSATESECGISSNDNVSLTSSNRNMLRIIGGRPTQHGHWPWQVAVLNRFKEAFCGGTLVAPRWVLTAAHCVRKRLYVRMGEHDLREKEGTELEMRVEMSISHPEYDLDTVDNDVALLRLPISVKFDKFRSVACLPKPRQTLPTNQLCTIIGWGKRRSSDMFGTDILQEAQVPIVTNEECREVYEDYQITGNMFCAGYKRGRMDSCAGDSGGPLLCRDGQGRWTVFGITSFGEGCGKKGKFGIYTRLPNYVRWVHRVMKSF